MEKVPDGQVCEFQWQGDRPIRTYPFSVVKSDFPAQELPLGSPESFRIRMCAGVYNLEKVGIITVSSK
ncbi:hypothetical protein [Laspinema olomoucense]|uniref:hypothetical protein n=1 Tax=Laspinema olomoucense TaxID=3231600 RepID=UPI0021BB74BC|nr:hypothetical protein [Laspinema sp. D3c]MCT7994656.1 hypothetical protein [Laspinema sp. D3c]